MSKDLFAESLNGEIGTNHQDKMLCRPRGSNPSMFACCLTTRNAVMYTKYLSIVLLQQFLKITVGILFIYSFI